MGTKRSVLWVLFLVLMTLISIVSIGRVFSKGGEPGLDFHSYWYPGHFVWQGADPYQSIFEGHEPVLPVHYWDGYSVTDGSVAQPGWRGIPANTAPVVFLLAPLSRLSWPNALVIWQLLNLALVLVVSWYLVRLLHQNPFSWRGWFILTIFLSLIATRETIEYGQTSMLVLASMLAAWYLGSRYPIAAGVLLGIALSKYSLAFPVFLLFIYKGWFKGLFVSLLVQLVAVLAIAINGGTSPFEVIGYYLRILIGHSDLPGMHLTAGILQNGGILSYIILLLGSMALFALLIRWYFLRRETEMISNYVVEFNLVTIVMLWNVLVFYHRRYDNIVNILFIALVALGVDQTTAQAGVRFLYSLSLNQRVGIYTLTGLTSLVWIMPVYLVLGDQLYIYLFNTTNCIALVLAVWLLFRFRRIGSEDPLIGVTDSHSCLNGRVLSA